MSNPSIPVPPLPPGRVFHVEGKTPFRVAHVLSRIVFTTLFDLKVYGAETFPPSGGVLVVSNHQSHLDPVILGVAIPRSLSYFAKSELFEMHPLFTRLIESLGAFPVRQTGSAAGAIKETIDRLQSGGALNIYPEGSRCTDGEIHPFEKGAALIIRKAKVPVVPVAIHGSFESFPPGTMLPKPHPIRVMFGPPMTHLHELKGEEITKVMQERVTGLYAWLRGQDPIYRERAEWAVQRRLVERAEKRRRKMKH
ncbi:lysophospholipid acyltransferase family protein [Humisphaera borealis]|uniref:1-acyl-sn-glycerol-3-phosphate acyltransferase n=1 Tax=Humisphaera borealis TaxID=2807512 RepID=A0A7M2WT92_9BACT|nr:lysophospholipid acyltransferase family protein [Humisphaera borealis]QOV88484.1 1-acyl-sn-glycerol-3-phosphate acyltransferase [Humisphaera borealis]